MRKLYIDQRGSGSIELLIAVMLLMFIFLASLEPVKMMYNQQILEQAKMKGLDAMQTKGGLTAEIEDAVKDYLVSRGFKEANLTISGTIGIVQWGDDISIELHYTDTTEEYKRTGLISMERVTKNIMYTVSGSTVSYFFDNN